MSDLAGRDDARFVNPPRITSDGRSIDVAFEGGVARLDADDLEVRSRIPTDIDVSSILVEVPGTSEVVGSGSNGLVGRWDMAEGREVVRGRSPEPSMLSDVDVSPDGEIVAAYHLVTYELVLFDAATLAPVGLPLPTGDFVHAPQFDPGDGTLLGNGLFNVNGITRTTMDPETWLERACHAAGRNLTREEWAEHVGSDEPYRRTCPEWPAPS